MLGRAIMRARNLSVELIGALGTCPLIASIRLDAGVECVCVTALTYVAVSVQLVMQLQKVALIVHSSNFFCQNLNYSNSNNQN